MAARRRFEGRKGFHAETRSRGEGLAREDAKFSGASRRRAFAVSSTFTPNIVIAGLDPAIQKARQRRLASQKLLSLCTRSIPAKIDAALRRLLDPRVKPGGDECGVRWRQTIFRREAPENLPFSASSSYAASQLRRTGCASACKNLSFFLLRAFLLRSFGASEDRPRLRVQNLEAAYSAACLRSATRAWVAMRSTYCAQSSTGRSWPMPSIETSFAPGTDLAVSSPPACGTSGSAFP